MSLHNMLAQIKGTAGDKRVSKDGLLICDDCGKTKDGKVSATICPFDEEIRGKRTECYLCDDCYHERCMDI